MSGGGIHFHNIMQATARIWATCVMISIFKVNIETLLAREERTLSGTLCGWKGKYGIGGVLPDVSFIIKVIANTRETSKLVTLHRDY